MSYAGGMEELVPRVGSGFVGAFVHMGSHQTFVNIIHFVPHILIFAMTLFLGALAGVIGWPTFLLAFLVCVTALVSAQKLSQIKEVDQNKYPQEVFKRTST